VGERRIAIRGHGVGRAPRPPRGQGMILPRNGPALVGIDFHKHIAPPSGVLLASMLELST